MGSLPVTLRKVRPSDAALLEKWDTDEAVIASNPNDAGESDWPAEIAADPNWRRFWIAEASGRAVGVLIDIDPAREESHYWGDCGPGLRAFDIWIGEAEARGRGVGAEIMRQALAAAFADAAVEAVVIDPLASNERAIRFYERIGFKQIERRRFGADDCLVMRLDRPA
ncbi:MAG: GNAT family N-acetyltransferase [Amphiplicatus sp.]